MFATRQNAKWSSKQKEMDALKAKNASLHEKKVALIDGNNKLKSSVKSSDRAGISEAKVMIETATGLSQKLNTELTELREKQKGVECQKRKLIEKSFGEVPLPTKKLRLNASLPKQAAKQNKKSNIRNTATTT